jgi:hypothetical protein
MLVHEALDLIEATEREVPAGDTAVRKYSLSRRLRFFAALGRNIESMWDPEEYSSEGRGSAFDARDNLSPPARWIPRQFQTRLC